MQVDSLKTLESIFLDWRRKKRHVTEQVPKSLVMRAQRSAVVYGVPAVVEATSIDRRRLKKRTSRSNKGEQRLARLGDDTTAGICAINTANRHGDKAVGSVPSYSRIELHAPETPAQLVAEIETPAGMRLRLFQVTAETVALVSALNGCGRTS